MAKYTTETGLELDEAVPDDRKILERQRDAARQAGREGADRAGTTKGRADLESAYDEGTSEAAAPSSEGTGGGGSSTGKPSAPARSGRSGSRSGGGGKGRKGSGGGGGLLRPTLQPPRSPVGGKDWAGFTLGLVLHALVVSYIRYGKEGPKGWLKAKFLNKPIQGDLERESRKDEHNGVDPTPSGRGPNGEVPAEGHMDDNTQIM